MWRRGGKRIADTVAALVLFVLLSPLLLLIALLVLLKIGSPVLFRQQRPGRSGKPFTIWKFRTMRSGDQPDNERLTAFGRWLRSTSLDELPELVNVLRGEMSLVGPRPLLMQYLSRYTPEQMRRHEVLPGITGWAQVNGRNAVGWEERFKLDVWYVDHMSLWLDLKILVMTIKITVKREGIAYQNVATMPEFRGNRAGGES
jgi:lipopolysaccharide/colanic/teichoic acid biosynthesis glycosyltransferase